MASGDTVSGAVNIQKVQDDVLELWSIIEALPEISNYQKNHIKTASRLFMRVLFALSTTLLIYASLELALTAIVLCLPSSAHKSLVLLLSPPSPPIKSHYCI